MLNVGIFFQYKIIKQKNSLRADFRNHKLVIKSKNRTPPLDTILFAAIVASINNISGISNHGMILSLLINQKNNRSPHFIP